DAAIREARGKILGATFGTGAAEEARAGLASDEELVRRQRLLSLACGWAEQSRLEALLEEVQRRLDCSSLSDGDREALRRWVVWAEGVAGSVSPLSGGLETLPKLTHAGEAVFEADCGV